MCVIDIFTLVYSPEIRKAKEKVIPCRYSVDSQPCSRTYIRDRGEHHVLSRSRSEGGYSRPSTYQTIEPDKYTKPAMEANLDESRHRPKRRTINLDMWGIRMPWTKWSIERESKRQEARITRERERIGREPSPFIVDPPDRQTHRPRSRSRRQYSSPIQEIRPKSPKSKERAPTSPPTPDPPVSSPSTSSPRQRHLRRPRERTPVSDRVPLRPRKPSSPPEPPIIIHHRRGNESPPLTPTREHRRQRCPEISPQANPIRHVHRSQDLRRQAEQDALNQPGNGTDYVYRARMEEDSREDSRRAAFADRDRRYATYCREERPKRSFAERQCDQMEHRGRDRYRPPLIIQEGRGAPQIHRESERIYASETRNPARNGYGFSSSIFDRLRPRQEYRDYTPGGLFPRRSSMPYGQRIALDDDSQRSSWRWR